MGRNRTFNEEEVLRLATARFLFSGYEATSVDDLLESTGLHRGSLYKAFGSKRGIFEAALELNLACDLPEFLSSQQPMTIERLAAQPALDLILVAALELAPHDEKVRVQVARAGELLDEALSTTECPPDTTAGAVALGARLWRRAQLAAHNQPTPIATSRGGLGHG